MNITANTEQLSQIPGVLKEYARLSGKSMGDVIAKEGREWSFGLYNEFKKISPTPRQIIDPRILSGYRVARRGDSLVKTLRGVSDAATRGTDKLLEGEKSDLFRIESDANGIRVRRVRFSARKGNKPLMGGRRGNRFAPSALRTKDVEAEAIARARNEMGARRLNRRALDVLNEMALRSRAAKGGTMAVQWLPEVYKKRSSSLVKTGTFVATSTTTNLPLGQVEVNTTGENPSVILSAFVPNTDKQISRHGILPRVEQARIADRMTYINRKTQEAFEAANRKRA